jgi:hypothetical protein
MPSLRSSSSCIANRSSALDGEYNPPGDGRELLKIVSAHGAVLKLETRPGVYLYFDMARRTFVNK